MRRKRVGEARRSTAYAAAAGQHAQAGIGKTGVPVCVQASPQIVVLGGGERGPAAGMEVRVGADTQVGPVNMGMGAVGVNQVCKAKALLNLRRMLQEVVNIDDAGDSAVAARGEMKLEKQPVLGNDAVGIGVGKPAGCGRRGRAGQGGFRGQRSGCPDTSAVAADDVAV